MTTYDPLTSEHIALLNQIAVSPLEISISDRQNMGPLQFLAQAGFLNAEMAHVAVNNLQSRIRYTRSNKPLPA